MKIVLFLVAAVVMMLSCLGCGEDRKTDRAEKAGSAVPGVENRAGATTPCSLISKAQVEEIFGEPFHEGEDRSLEKNPLGQRICFWNTAASRSFRFLQVSIIKTSAMPAGTGAGAETIFRQTRENLTPIQAVANVGDEAFWGTMGLHLLQGDAYINIAVGNSNRLGNLQIAKRVAVIVLSNLAN
jgi:hypothetical protein